MGKTRYGFFKFTKAILNDEPIDVFNNGNHRRDFTYIDDIVEGIIRVLDKPALPDPNWDNKKPNSGSSNAPWRLYNIGRNQPVELMDYIRALEKALGKKSKNEFIAFAARRCSGYLCKCRKFS